MAERQSTAGSSAGNHLSMYQRATERSEGRSVSTGSVMLAVVEAAGLRLRAARLEGDVERVRAHLDDGDPAIRRSGDPAARSRLVAPARGRAPGPRPLALRDHRGGAVMTYAPRLFALDEQGDHIEAWLGTYREGSKFASWPGVPAAIDVTEGAQIGPRLVLLDVDTLQVRRVDRLELEGKWQCQYAPGSSERISSARSPNAGAGGSATTPEWSAGRCGA